MLTVSGFSPFAIVWKDPPPATPTPAPTAAPKTEPTATPAPAVTADATPAPTAAPSPSPNPDLKVPPTGDGTPITALYTAASASAAGLVVLRPRRRKKR